MGGAMEAYFDKATGKWVIPGEVRNETRWDDLIDDIWEEDKNEREGGREGAVER